MTIAQKDLEKIARLAYLDTESSDFSQLIHEVGAIMDFVDQLRGVDTHGIAPLFHPISSNQRLRMDEVTEENCLAELEAMAPLFEDHLYLVPKVIESDK